MKTKTLRLVAVVTLLFGVGAPLAAQPPAIIPDKSAPDLPPGAIARLGISRLPMGGPRAFAADGNSFVGLSGDGFIVRFDARTGNQVGEKILVPDAAQHPKLSADGRFLVFMLKQTEIQVIETATGRIIFRRLVPDLCFGAQLTADGMSVVVPNKKGNDSRFLAWDLATGTERVLMEKGADFRYMHLSPDGKRFLVAPEKQKTMQCRSLEDASIEWETERSTRMCEYSADGSRIIEYDLRINGPDASWRAIDSTTGKAVAGFRFPKQNPEWVPALAPDNRTLLVPTRSGVIFWDLKEGREMVRLPGTDRAINNDRIGPFAPDGKSVLTNFGAVQRWELPSGRSMLPDSSDMGHTAAPGALAFSPDGKWLASGAYEDHTIRVWDVQAKRAVHNLRGHTAYIRRVLFTPDSKRLLSGGGDSTVRIWDVADGRSLHIGKLHDSDKQEDWQQVCDMQLKPGGRQVIVLGIENFHVQDDQDNVISVWDTVSGKRLEEHRNPLGRQHRDSNRELSWAHLATSGHVLLWGGELLSPTTGKESLPKLELREGEAAYWARFSPDERLIAAAVAKPREKQQECDIVVWEAASGRPVRRFHTKGDSWELLLQMKGSNLYSASSAGVQVFDMCTGRELRAHPVPGDKRFPTQDSFAVSPDGRIAATGTFDGTILLWDVTTPQAAPAPWNQAEAPGLWADLTNPDAAKGVAAVARFLDHPAEALAFLKEHLKPAAAPPAEQVKSLIADLANPTFKTREAAEKRLHEFGEQIEGSLQDALKANPTPEARNRIKALREALAPTNVPQPEALRSIRAVWVLERIGTPEAKKFLEELTKGLEFARLTKDAKAALVRLGS